MPDIDSGPDDLHGRLVALAERANGFELAADPYQAVRDRGRALRWHRLTAVAAVVAVALLVTGTITAGLLPHRTDRVRPAATPTDAPPATAPALPTGRAVVGHGTVATGLASPCNRGNCPALLETMGPDDRTHWYRLPVPLLAASAPYTPMRRASLSADGRWLLLAQGTDREVLRDLAGTRVIQLPAGEAFKGWQPWLTGSGPLRWALVQKDVPTDLNASVLYRLDLRTGTRVAYPLGAGAWNHAAGVLPSGDLVITTATQNPSTTIGDVLVRTIDPVSHQVRHQIRVPQDHNQIQLSAFLTPDGNHLLGGDGGPHGTMALVDLVTGAVTTFNLLDVAAAAPGATRPELGNEFSEWTVGFVGGSGTFQERFRGADHRMYVVSVRLVPDGGGVRVAGVGIAPYSLVPPREAPGEFEEAGPVW
jgi:hypothetical protein